MIRITDAFTLAYTKLRTHRIRTGITVAISGLLFGVLLWVLLVTQGLFNSVDRFGTLGLNDRYIVSVSDSGAGYSFNPYDHLNDATFVAEVQAEYDQLVARKQTAAKKYNVPYVPATDDPSPIKTDTSSRQKVVDDARLDSRAVQAAVAKRYARDTKPFAINEYIKRYKTATVLGTANQLMPHDGQLTYMKDGKEQVLTESSPQAYMFGQSDTPSLLVLDASVTSPFVSQPFDSGKGEVPVILPFGAAEKLLGLKKLSPSATAAEKYDRLRQVKQRVGEITASFCYRSTSSQQLFAEAVAQQKEIAKNKTTAGYEAPSQLYAAPSVTDCAAVTTASDKRTTLEKQIAQNLVAYQKEIGDYPGDPIQHKVTVRGVGISGDYPTGQSVSAGQIIQSLLTSSLAYGSWVVPQDLLQKLPPADRPDEVFVPKPPESSQMTGYAVNTYLVEFKDKAEARRLLDSTGFFGSGGSGQVFAMPFGSATLVVDELRVWVTRVVVWLLLGIGVLATIILWGIIGRTVSDGRKESAVFRAIGARRIDIASIYGTYALLLGLRVVVFAAVLAIVGAVVVEVLFAKDATIGARYAYAAPDTNLAFHFVGVNNSYIAMTVVAIVGAALIAAMLPIVRNARRNPIRDMRDD